MHELISTMLSHRTTHANEEKAYYRMRELYPTWPEVIIAPVEDLTKAFETAQYPGPKAINIQKALKIIQEKSPDFSLRFLDGYACGRSYGMADEFARRRIKNRYPGVVV